MHEHKSMHAWKNKDTCPVAPHICVLLYMSCSNLWKNITQQQFTRLPVHMVWSESDIRNLLYDQRRGYIPQLVCIIFSPCLQNLHKLIKGDDRVQFLLILCSQNAQTLVVQLEERCILEPFTTPRPNVTATQPNTTTTDGNVTSPPLNTTATTTAATDTVATTLTATVSVTPSESPTTTESGLFVSNVWVQLTHNYGIVGVAWLWHLF